MLIAFAGLPGVGKTTVAQDLSVALGAVYLRIDAIETAMLIHDPMRDIGPEGYQIAASLAVSNLRLGHLTIVDSVNPIGLTRRMYREAAAQAGADHLGVELICSSPAVHRTRVETRVSDLPGQVLPDWTTVMARDYVTWDDADVRIDTAQLSVAEAVARIRQLL